MSKIFSIIPVVFEEEFFRWFIEHINKDITSPRLKNVGKVKIEDCEDVDDELSCITLDCHEQVRDSEIYKNFKGKGNRKYLECTFKVQREFYTARIYQNGKITIMDSGSRNEHEDFKKILKFIYLDMRYLRNQWLQR